MRPSNTDVVDRSNAAPGHWRILVSAVLIVLFVLALLGRPWLSWFI